MSKTANEEMMNEIHRLQAQAMLERLKSGEELTAQEFNAITKFLKDNEITVDPFADTDVRKLGEETSKAANTLPFPKDGAGFTEEEMGDEDDTAGGASATG